MPIYEYRCAHCEHEFETLVRGGESPACTACGSQELERVLSLPAVNSEQTRARALGAAKRRDAAEAKDRSHEQLKYERSHND
jgi:putative FmdB family regulatory protein